MKTFVSTVADGLKVKNYGLCIFIVLCCVCEGVCNKTSKPQLWNPEHYSIDTF